MSSFLLSQPPDEETVKEVLAKNYVDAKTRKDQLCRRLQKLTSVLTSLQQDTPHNLKYTAKRLAEHKLIHHKSKEVKLLVACALSDILRLMAPDPPYKRSQLKAIFELFIDQLKGLKKESSPQFPKCYHILESINEARSCVLLIEKFEDDELLVQMFNALFDLANEDCSSKVQAYVMAILTDCLDQTDGEVSPELMDTLFLRLIPPESTTNPASHKWASGVVNRCHELLERAIVEFVTLSIIGRQPTRSAIKERSKKLELLYELCTVCGSVFLSMLPQLQDLLQDQELTTRLEYVQLFGRIFTTESSTTSRDYKQLFLAFLKRFNDVQPEVRRSMADFGKELLLYNPQYQTEISEYMISRSQDKDENVREATIASTCEAALENPAAVPARLLGALGERVLDRKASVRDTTINGFASIFKKHVAPHWKKGEPLPSSCRKFSGIPKRIQDALGHNIDLSLHVETLMDEVILDKSNGMEDRVVLMLAIVATFDKPQKAKFLKMVSHDKKNLQGVLQRLVKCKEGMKKNAANKHEVEKIKKQQISLANMVAERVPMAHKTKEKTVDLLLNLFANPHNNKIIKWLLLLSDPSTDYDALRAAKDELKKALGSRSAAAYYADRLISKVAMHIINKDSCLQMLKGLLNGNQSLLPAGLSLLRGVAHDFPILFQSKEAFKYLSEMAMSEQKLANNVALEILSLSGNEKYGAEVNRKLGKHLREIAFSGTARDAGFAIQILKRIHSGAKRNKIMTNILEECIDDLNVDRDNLPTILTSLGRIACDCPKIFDTKADEIVGFISTKLLLHDGEVDLTLLSPKSKKKPEELVSKLTEAKVAGIETLVRYLTPYSEREQKYENEEVEIDYSVGRKIIDLFIDILHSDGDLKKSGMSDEDAAELVVASAVGLLKLCESRKYEMMLTPEQFQTISLVGHNDNGAVRTPFYEFVWKRLRESKLPFYFSTMMAFAGTLSLNDEHLRKTMQTSLQLLIARARKHNEMRQRMTDNKSVQVQKLPEYNLTYLIHLVAHHPDFEEDERDDFDYIVKILNFYIDALIHGRGVSNFTLIWGILSTIKEAQDVQSPHSLNIYIAAELAQILLKLKYKGKNWGPRYPAEIPLPAHLYKVRGPHAPAKKLKYLREAFKLPDLKQIKRGVRVSREERAARGDEGEDSDDDSDSEEEEEEEEEERKQVKIGMKKKKKSPSSSNSKAEAVPPVDSSQSQKSELSESPSKEPESEPQEPESEPQQEPDSEPQEPEAEPQQEPESEPPQEPESEPQEPVPEDEEPESSDLEMIASSQSYDSPRRRVFRSAVKERKPKEKKAIPKKRKQKPSKSSDSVSPKRKRRKKKPSKKEQEVLTPTRVMRSRTAKTKSKPIYSQLTEEEFEEGLMAYEEYKDSQSSAAVSPQKTVESEGEMTKKVSKKKKRSKRKAQTTSEASESDSDAGLGLGLGADSDVENKPKNKKRKTFALGSSDEDSEYEEKKVKKKEKKEKKKKKRSVKKEKVKSQKAVKKSPKKKEKKEKTKKKKTSTKRSSRRKKLERKVESDSSEPEESDYRSSEDDGENHVAVGSSQASMKSTASASSAFDFTDESQSQKSQPNNATKPRKKKRKIPTSPISPTKEEEEEEEEEEEGKKKHARPSSTLKLSRHFKRKRLRRARV